MSTLKGLLNGQLPLTVINNLCMEYLLNLRDNKMAGKTDENQ